MNSKSERFVSADLINAIAGIDSEIDPVRVFQLFSDYLKRFGFATVALGQLSNPAMRPANGANWFAVGNWPDDWKRQWIEKNYIIHDPIARLALKTRRSFTWRHAYEHASLIGRTILNASRDFGFDDGLAIPLHPEDSPPGCITLGAERLDLSARERAAVELISVHAYTRLETLYGPFKYQKVRPLTPREIEILHFAAAGKTNWEIGRILAISEFGVRDQIAKAQRKLNCANRAHTVAVAIQKGLIFP
jgi:LuxR family quorum sensing-dependent transcriptional regulator